MAEDNINILWIDDEHELLTGFVARSKVNGILLKPYKSLNCGMTELERNYSSYDGILLDAQILENENDMQGSEDTIYVHRAKERILQIPKKFDIFVLTGQAGAYENNTFHQAFPTIYRKGIDDDINRLFSDLKKSAANQKDTQFRFKYKRVFDVCSNEYLGEMAGNDILKLLKISESSESSDLNGIRKILEDLIRSFHAKELIPYEFVFPEIRLSESIKFLSGKQINKHVFNGTDYKNLHQTHLPVPITEALRYLISLTHPGSHRSEIDIHIKMYQTNYFFICGLNLLFEILTWYKQYVDSSPPKNNWETVSESVNANRPRLPIIKNNR